MITGDKYTASTVGGINNVRQFSALVLIIALVSSVVFLTKGYDRQNERLQIFGYQIPLSAEEEEGDD